MADAQDGVLAPAAQPQMAMVHQEVDTVVFGRDGVGRFERNGLDELGFFDVQFVAANGPRFGAQSSAQDQRRLLRQILQHLKHFDRDIRLHGDALNDAAAVADEREDDLAGLAEIVKPACDLDGFADVRSGLVNFDPTIIGHLESLQPAENFARRHDRVWKIGRFAEFQH